MNNVAQWSPRVNVTVVSGITAVMGALLVVMGALLELWGRYWSFGGIATYLKPLPDNGCFGGVISFLFRGRYVRWPITVVMGDLVLEANCHNNQQFSKHEDKNMKWYRHDRFTCASYNCFDCCYFPLLLKVVHVSEHMMKGLLSERQK